MDDNPDPGPKWEGQVRAKLTGPAPDLAWSLLSDFCSLHRWVPFVATCHKLEGEDNQPGCIRYCAGPVNKSDPSEPVGWSKERLVAFDPAARSYTYEIVETNKGFGRYAATMAIAPDPDGDANSCWIEWSFEADPVKGWTREGFVAFLEAMAQAVAARVEEETNAIPRAGY